LTLNVRARLFKSSLVFVSSLYYLYQVPSWLNFTNFDLYYSHRTVRISNKQSILIILIYPQTSSSGISRQEPSKTNVIKSRLHGKWVHGSVKGQYCSWTIMEYTVILASSWFTQLHPLSWSSFYPIHMYFFRIYRKNIISRNKSIKLNFYPALTYIKFHIKLNGKWPDKLAPDSFKTQIRYI
jgi:hypothetical protein